MMQDVKAVLLVGGLGTRLRSVVPSTPKVLASVGKRSFLELLVEQLRSQGIRRLVMCSGYLADQIETEFGDGRGSMATLAVLRVEDASRYGTVHVDGDGRVRRFAEKTGSSVPGLVNGGVYIFDHAVLRHIPERPASLERDVFPRLLDQGMYTLEQNGMFIDIGTPADYARAQLLSDSLKAAAQGQISDPAVEK
jgi:NDP-sugar pyrophosphorylase family protein